jgi:hypothetical protein
MFAREIPLELAMIAPTLDAVSFRFCAGECSLASPLFAQFVVPRYTLENAPEVDVLLVPGGLGNSGEAATVHTRKCS